MIQSLEDFCALPNTTNVKSETFKAFILPGIAMTDGAFFKRRQWFTSYLQLHMTVSSCELEAKHCKTIENPWDSSESDKYAEPATSLMHTDLTRLSFVLTWFCFF